MALREGGYGQYCPVARALEVLGERWTLLIVRDLLCGATRFNELSRANPRLSRSLLAKRLRQLETAGVVERLDGEYLLTPAGQDLHSVVFGLGGWGARWQFGDPREDELDPELLMVWVQDRLDFSGFPDRRIVLEFHFRGDPRRYWIVKDALGPSLCTHDPGFEVDVLVEADLAALYQVWVGRLDLGAATRDGLVQLLGAPSLVRRMPGVLLLSPVAPLVAVAR
ncbi:MAG: helix-turn-helix transcriptional regulator [Acidimicrobiia bacterium]|nr:helix-turn-helix transcriptional regulator [Acidimicrobiia bacterium]